ncbi:hypothetical protein M378DRAFT_157448 [Amanita muscaria Koide BX008]|uniref:Uncharacterized protein n=1 Tax=Amanita muscaria (strain Koide BX008) TaxID=946122 RepID=A0A0C2X4M2_AMAMK|nr:hypothetical protein M378DRAFT_157448 [Amanita muscaria Koide BX008]
MYYCCQIDSGHGILNPDFLQNSPIDGLWLGRQSIDHAKHLTSSQSWNSESLAHTVG